MKKVYIKKNIEVHNNSSFLAVLAGIGLGLIAVTLLPCFKRRKVKE